MALCLTGGSGLDSIDCGAMEYDLSFSAMMISETTFQKIQVVWDEQRKQTYAYAKEINFFQGQPDPKDPSRFTLAFDIDGRKGTVNGFLGDDGAIHLSRGDGDDLNAIGLLIFMDPTTSGGADGAPAVGF